MVALTDVRNIFGHNVEFVFEFDDNGTLYVCKNAPDGWDKQQIQVVRNRKRYGVARAFTQNLFFVKDEIDYLRNYVDDNKYEGNLKLNIYELNQSTMYYDLLFTGIAQFKDYEIKDFKFKLTLLDSDLANLIEKNGDKDFSIPSSEFTPYLKNLTFGGVSLVEQATIERTTNGLRVPARYCTPVQEDVFINLSTTNLKDIDANITEFNLIDSEVIEYEGNPTQATLPIIIIKKNGVVTIDINYQFAIYLGNYNELPPVGWDLRINNGSVDMGPTVITLGSGAITWNNNPLRYNNTDRATFSCVTTATFNVSENEELYLMLRIIREDGGTGNATTPFTLYHNIGTLSQQVTNTMKVVFYETYADKTIKGIPLDDLSKLALSQATNGVYDTINGISEFHNILVTTGNLMRGLTEPSINCKVNDLFDIFMKKLGQGFEIIDNEVTFDTNHDFFDLTLWTNLGEVSEFSEKAMTDYLYSHVQSGDKEYDTEYLSGKKSIHEVSMFKTPVNSVDNTLDLVTEISANPFEIEDVFRNSTGTDEETDYEPDGKLFLIWCKITDGTYSIDRDNYDIENSSSYPTLDFPYPRTIYNLNFSPSRIIERNLFNVHQSLIADADVIECKKRTKYEDYFSKFTTDGNIHYEGRGFKISPRCGTTTAPVLIDDNQKLLPVAYEFKHPLTGITIPTVMSNIRKLVLFSFNSVRMAGFIDVVGRNPATKDPQNVTLIKANLTTEEINALWQI